MLDISKYQGDITDSWYQLKQKIEMYYGQRGLKWPSTEHALMFIVTEIGEACDAFLRNDPEYLRNNQKTRELGTELSDIMLMVFVACIGLGVNPLRLMYNKMNEKVAKDIVDRNFVLREGNDVASTDAGEG